MKCPKCHWVQPFEGLKCHFCGVVMQCPECHKLQDELLANSASCHSCGLVFEKWFSKHEKDAGLAPASQRAVLEVSPTGVNLFSPEKPVMVLFGLLLFYVEPAVSLIHNLVASDIQFSALALVSTCCTVMGILAGAISYNDGFSAVLTAGGAGLIGSAVRLAGLYLLLSDIQWQSYPIASLGGSLVGFTLLGGVITWILKTFLGTIFS